MKLSRPLVVALSALGCVIASAAGCELFTNEPARSGESSSRAGSRSRASDGGEGGSDDEADGGDQEGHEKAAAPGRLPADLNVLLLSVDSLRADMPWAGYPRAIAPRLTELEARAVSYTHAYALSSYTSMSLGGLLGGKYPSEMKRDGYFFGTYAKDNLMFPEVLEAAHVHTAAGQAHGYFRGLAFRQGFERYEMVPDITFKPTTDENITSPRHEALAEKLLSEKACTDGRFFAWFHFMDPHDRYFTHEPDVKPWGKGLRDRYDGEVQFTDHYLGKLLDFVASKPWGARTVIIVTADHGEGFGEHGRYAHGFELWQNLVRVPLFFVIPGVAPHRIDAPRSALDLAPTILSLFGLPKVAEFEGEDLLPEIEGTESPAVRDVLVDLPQTSDSDRRRALIHGKYKLIAFGQDVSMKVFDLEADPTEDHPITSGEAFADMVARYKAKSATLHDVPPYSCRAGCLNGGYLKPSKDTAGGAKPAL